MIFVTVGTQLPFDRLIQAIDQWAAVNRGVEVFAQIGPSKFRPTHLRSAEFISPTDAERYTKEAQLVVSHAGMGSILTALKHQRPILIVPRKASLGEHRNEHQLATARWMVQRPGVTVAWDEQEVVNCLNRRDAIATGGRIPDVASGPLVDRLRQFIFNAKVSEP
ncbi:MAG: glycosyl transferase family 28 [Rubrivivax sp.]|nr:MAG: glycosyl transferase family 28 [Rubrivivax sp.]